METSRWEAAQSKARQGVFGIAISFLLIASGFTSCGPKKATQKEVTLGDRYSELIAKSGVALVREIDSSLEEKRVAVVHRFDRRGRLLLEVNAESGLMVGFGAETADEYRDYPVYLEPCGRIRAAQAEGSPWPYARPVKETWDSYGNLMSSTWDDGIEDHIQRNEYGWITRRVSRRKGSLGQLLWPERTVEYRYENGRCVETLEMVRADGVEHRFLTRIEYTDLGLVSTSRGQYSVVPTKYMPVVRHESCEFEHNSSGLPVRLTLTKSGKVVSVFEYEYEYYDSRAGDDDDESN